MLVKIVTCSPGDVVTNPHFLNTKILYQNLGSLPCKGVRHPAFESVIKGIWKYPPMGVRKRAGSFALEIYVKKITPKINNEKITNMKFQFQVWVQCNPKHSPIAISGHLEGLQGQTINFALCKKFIRMRTPRPPSQAHTFVVEEKFGLKSKFDFSPSKYLGTIRDWLSPTKGRSCYLFQIVLSCLVLYCLTPLVWSQTGRRSTSGFWLRVVHSVQLAV